MPILRQRISKYFACLLVILLTLGCDKSDIPSNSWEIAVQGLYSASISSNSEYNIVGSIHHGGSMWDLRSKERLFNWNHTKGEYTGIVASSFSPDNRYAATASHRTIVLWEIGSGKPIWFWTAPGDVLSMALTPNGDYALLGLANHTAVLFDIKNGGVKRVLNHNGKVRSVSLSDDAKLALTGSDDRTAKLWNLQSAENIHSWHHDNQIVITALSPNGRYAFTAAQADKALIWDTSSGKAVREMPIKKGSYIAGAAYTAARFSADETRILTGTNSRLVQLWDIKTEAPLRTWTLTKRDLWKPTSATVLAVGFSSQGNRYYATASNGFSHELK